MLIEIVREIGPVKKTETLRKYELVSIHTGRKHLKKGIPLKDVMSMTTHTSFKAVKRYINVTKERKKPLMTEGWGAAQKSNLKAV